ncbi:hypothetical protein ACVGVM_19400 [Pseudonocardia bannensis]|uniref:Uncharacterized protein n=1 Tax=Pseudonocardia bannensis TaxID=630973 RepID=A0A848DJI9_9PSEU|nr:hypothetical protein [Pseudonocardia bannensis]NMH92696.1 hypothetical protein [Pseudonocardia bannensis]
MSPVVTLRVHRPNLVKAEQEVRKRLQAVATAELSRLRAGYIRQSQPVIETALAERLGKVTGGRVVEQDLPTAARAVQCGHYLVVDLVGDPGSATEPAPTVSVAESAR